MGPSRPYFEADCLEGLPRRIPASRAGPSDKRAGKNSGFGNVQRRVVLRMPVACARQSFETVVLGPSGSGAGSLLVCFSPAQEDLPRIGDVGAPASSGFRLFLSSGDAGLERDG
jgi:hypothetical protein